MKEKWWHFQGNDNEKEKLLGEVDTRRIIGNQPGKDIRKEKFGGIGSSDEGSEYEVKNNPEARKITEKIEPDIVDIELSIKRKEYEVAELETRLDKIMKYKKGLSAAFDINSAIARLTSDFSKAKDMSERDRIEKELELQNKKFDLAIFDVATLKKSKEIQEIENGMLEIEEEKARAKVEEETKALNKLKAKLHN